MFICISFRSVSPVTHTQAYNFPTGPITAVPLALLHTQSDHRVYRQVRFISESCLKPVRQFDVLHGVENRLCCDFGAGFSFKNLFCFSGYFIHAGKSFFKNALVITF